MARFLKRIPASATLHPAEVNGRPALVLRMDGVLDTVIGVRIEDGRIAEFHAVRNPEKLSHMDRVTRLHR